MAAGLFLYAHGYYVTIPSVPAQILFFEHVAAGQVSLEELAEFYRQQTTPR